MSFKSVFLVCLTTFVIGFMTLDFCKRLTRYAFLVNGDVCILFDRQEKALKIVGTECVTVPLEKTTDQLFSEKIDQEISKQVKNNLAILGTPKNMPMMG